MTLKRIRANGELCVGKHLAGQVVEVEERAEGILLRFQRKKGPTPTAHVRDEVTGATFAVPDDDAGSAAFVQLVLGTIESRQGSDRDAALAELSLAEMDVDDDGMTFAR